MCDNITLFQMRQSPVNYDEVSFSACNVYTSVYSDNIIWRFAVNGIGDSRIDGCVGRIDYYDQYEGGFIVHVSSRKRQKNTLYTTRSCSPWI